MDGPTHNPPLRKRSLNRDGTPNLVPFSSRHAFTDFYHWLLSVSWPGLLALIFAFYLSVNVVFGLVYFSLGTEALEGVHNASAIDHLLDCFFFSVQTFATIGYGRIVPATLAANIAVTFEALAGLLTISLATGLLFARFSRPTARIVFSNVAVINSQDGQPSLLFRMANQRSNLISRAEVGVVLLIDEATAEGEQYRSFYDLELERTSTPMFALSWTILHPINERSPLRKHTKESLKAANAELIVTFQGTDDTFSQEIRARFSYVPDEILWDRRFKDVIKRDARGRTWVDVEHFHQVI